MALVISIPHIVAAPTELAAVSAKERQNGYSKGAFTEEELTAIRGGMTAEEFRLYLIRTFLRD